MSHIATENACDIVNTLDHCVERVGLSRDACFILFQTHSTQWFFSTNNMAQRRMFSLKVVDTDMFLDMSPSAQNLYFHLGMRADDDGFVSSPKKIMAITNASEDDMRVLVAKNFVIPMATNGVSVITHWHTNNLIRPDRYQETGYKEEKSRLEMSDGKYITSFGIPNVIPNGNQMATQVRLGKVRLGKVTTSDATASRVHNPLGAEIVKAFEAVNPACKRMYGIPKQREACDDLIESYGLEQVLKVIALLPKTNGMEYVPTITTPLQLRDKWVSLESNLRSIKDRATPKNTNCIIL